MVMQGSSQFSLSVVVTVVTGPTALRQTMEDLVKQRDAPVFDVVVVDTTGLVQANDISLPEFRGGIRLVSAYRCDVAEARSLGVPAARGNLIAFTEDLCRLPDDWCATVVTTRTAGHRAFGGAIANVPSQGPADWAAYLVEFGAFMPPLPAGPTDALPGMNVCYDRALIESVPEGGLCEPIVNGYLRENGLRLHLEPTLVVTFDRSFGVARFVRHCFASGRTFARLRLARRSGLSRVVYAAAASGLPMVLTVRIGARLSTRRKADVRFLLSLPWIVLYTCAWSVGEAVAALYPSPSAPTRS